LLGALADLLKTADIAAVLLRLKPSDPRTLISRIKALAPVIQDHGGALLLDGHADLVARAAADGAHLFGLEAFEQALPTLKPDRIAGVGGLATRHDSMTAGELGADYVLFGEPDEKGQRPSMQAICDRLQWWDEVFELPSVGFAATLEEVGAFTAAGADFVLVGDFIWGASDGPKSALRAAAEAVRKAHGATPANAETSQG
jgi:thiamine-phosphate pyrophosphorylase